MGESRRLAELESALLTVRSATALWQPGSPRASTVASWAARIE
jgi:hypothetical protein